LAEILALPHVVYLGALDYHDPLLASAYAAAGVFCLPSLSEVMPLCVLEALAAGTPVVMTKNHCMDIAALLNVVDEIEPNNQVSIRQAVLKKLTDSIQPAECRDKVSSLSWDSVSADLALIYRRVLSKPQA